MLYLHVSVPRLALKLFRGEPAISGFDWNFSLSTPHPHPFQRMWVRSSIAFYGSFNLDMDRSPGFGSAHTDSGPIKTWFPYGSAPLVLNLACMRKLAGPFYKKYAVEQKNVLPQLVNTGFQVLFHSPPGVLFTFPSQYYALSVTKEYLALRGGPRSFSQGSTCLDYSGSRCAFSLFPYGAFTLSGWLSQNHSGKIKGSRPRSEPQHARTLVWALSLSLAATQEIEFSFSSSAT